MNDKKTDTSRGSRANSVLSCILIVLLSITILAVLVVGGMFIMRVVSSDPPPSITNTVTPNTEPPSGTNPPDTSVPPVTNIPSSDSTTEVTPPATDAPNTDSPKTEPVTEPVTDPVTDAPDIPVITSSAYLAETSDGGETYLKRLVFLGDSTTYHMHHYTDLEDEQIWVPQAGTLDLYDITNKSVAMPIAGVDYRDWVDAPITSVLAAQKPDILVVTLGINFSAFYGKEEHGWTMDKKETYFKLQITNIKKIVNKYSPETKLVFQTIYPVIDSELIEDGSPIRNEHIRLRNSWLIEICEELSIPVLKTEDVLMDESGQLKKEFNTYHLDGVHINPDGYKAILNYVRTHTVP